MGGNVLFQHGTLKTRKSACKHLHDS